MMGRGARGLKGMRGLCTFRSLHLVDVRGSEDVSRYKGHALHIQGVTKVCGHVTRFSTLRRTLRLIVDQVDDQYKVADLR